FAIYVQQTGILLTLAFDLMLACLVVPFILGLVWRRGTTAAAVVPRRHTSPRMNGTTRQASIRSKASVSRIPVC
ncbi:hypothetical protein C6A85_08600, partial [Mycobacterium sp. ITM-2017-0098]